MAIQDKTKLVAIVDEDDYMRCALQGQLKVVGLPARACASAEEFLKSGQKHQTACLLSDICNESISTRIYEITSRQYL